MALKLAISGKGGVGKTTLSALLARTLAARGFRVIAIDADPVTNLAAALGIAEEPPIVPISQLHDLIHERTGAEPGRLGVYFKMNPKVDDLPDKLSRERDGVKLLVMGTVTKGGSGCVCPESVMLKALTQHVVFNRDDVVIMDMEAGVEHLGRASAVAMDALLIVVDPGARSQTAARQIVKLAADLKLKRIFAIGNRVATADEEARLQAALPEIPFLGFLPPTDEVAQADRQGRRPYEPITAAPAALGKLVDGLLALRPDGAK